MVKVEVEDVGMGLTEIYLYLYIYACVKLLIYYLLNVKSPSFFGDHLFTINLFILIFVCNA